MSHSFFGLTFVHLSIHVLHAWKHKEKSLIGNACRMCDDSSYNPFAEISHMAAIDDIFHFQGRKMLQSTKSIKYVEYLRV